MRRQLRNPTWNRNVWYSPAQVKIRRPRWHMQSAHTHPHPHTAPCFGSFTSFRRKRCISQASSPCLARRVSAPELHLDSPLIIATNPLSAPNATVSSFDLYSVGPSDVPQTSWCDSQVTIMWLGQEVTSPNWRYHLSRIWNQHLFTK